MKKYYIFILATVSLFLNSCSSLLSPGLYDEEIRDAVKFHLAEAEYITEYINDYTSNPFSQLVTLLSFDAMSERFDDMEDEILTLYNTTDMNFRQVLQHMSDTEYIGYQREAQDILENYDQLNITLSDYEQMSSSLNYTTWTFKELHSGVEFIFEIHDPDEGQSTWTCIPIQQSLEEWMEYLIK